MTTRAGIDEADRKLLGLIAAAKDGRITASLPQIASAVDRGDVAVRLSLLRLEKRGFLAWERVGGGYHSNSYTITDCGREWLSRPAELPVSLALPSPSNALGSRPPEPASDDPREVLHFVLHVLSDSYSWATHPQVGNSRLRLIRAIEDALGFRKQEPGRTA